MPKSNYQSVVDFLSLISDNATIKYLEYLVINLSSNDPKLHNQLISLYFREYESGNSTVVPRINTLIETSNCIDLEDALLNIPASS